MKMAMSRRAAKAHIVPRASQLMQDSGGRRIFENRTGKEGNLHLEIQT